MKRGDFDDLKRAVEDERLRLKETKGRGTYGTEYLRIFTPQFVRKYNDNALILGIAEYGRTGSSEAQNATKIMETELRLRDSASSSVTRRHVFWTLLVTLTGAAIGAVALWRSW